MGQRAYETFRTRYTAERNHDMLMAIYREAMDEPSGRASGGGR